MIQKAHQGCEEGDMVVDGEGEGEVAEVLLST